MKANPVKRVIDTGLSNIRLTETERARLTRIAMNETARPRCAKHGFSWGAACVAVILLACTVAFAAQTLGFVDWSGRFTPISPHAQVQPTPALPHAAQTDMDAVHALLESVPDGEYWKVFYKGGGTGVYGFFGARVNTVEELASHLKGIELRLPNIPEGYRIVAVELSYRLPDSEGATPYAREQHGNLALNKYRFAAVTDDDVEGYQITLTGGEGKKLTMDAYLVLRAEYEEPEAGEFLIGDGETCETLTVAGFDRAIAIRREGGAREILFQKDIDADLLANYYVYIDEDLDPACLFARPAG